MPVVRSRIYRFFFDNLGIKIIALLMAGALWFYAVSEQEQTKTLDVPVELTGMEGGRVQVAGTVPETVKVTVEGKGSDLIRLTGEDLRANIDLRNLPEGETTVDLKPENIVGPGTFPLKILQVEGGGDIRLDITRLGEKQVSVRVRHTGSPPPGMSYFIGFNIAANSRVTVIGPRSVLAGIDYVETEPVDLTGHDSDFTVTVKLISPEPEVKIADFDQVDLKVRIMPTPPPPPAAKTEKQKDKTKPAHPTEPPE
jgi:YbbR domain-containing protein